jgi:hypothetical protein
MRRGTTPDYLLTIDKYDLTDTTVFVTLEQSSRELTLTGYRLDIQYDAEHECSQIIFRLTQQETLSLGEGMAKIQVRFIDDTGTALATNIGTVAVKPVLYEEVIAYADGTNPTSEP